MRALALLAAMMHTIHALPRQDLAVRQGVDDLSNESHIFHHLDRNQRTANRDRERVHGDNSGKGSGIYVVKRLPDRPQRAGWWALARGRAVDRRFMQSPDYSEGGSASDTMPMQQPAAKAEGPEETASSD